MRNLTLMICSVRTGDWSLVSRLPDPVLQMCTCTAHTHSGTHARTHAHYPIQVVWSSSGLCLLSWLNGVMCLYPKYPNNERDTVSQLSNILSSSSITESGNGVLEDCSAQGLEEFQKNAVEVSLHWCAHCPVQGWRRSPESIPVSSQSALQLLEWKVRLQCNRPTGDTCGKPLTN